jgi:glutathione S-transferase
MKLYYMQGACSLAPHFILEELGLPYQGVLISGDKGENETPEFKKLNPTGAVPVLVLDDGKVITENVAILSYLADLKPEAKLLPPANSFERIRALEWLSFSATYIHHAFGNIFGAKYLTKDKSAADQVEASGRARAEEHFNFVESRLNLTKSNYVLGSNYTVCDAYLFVFFSWAKHLKFDLSRWPAYSALAARIAERPASLRVLKIEDLLD